MQPNEDRPMFDVVFDNSLMEAATIEAASRDTLFVWRGQRDRTNPMIDYAEAAQVNTLQDIDDLLWHTPQRLTIDTVDFGILIDTHLPTADLDRIFTDPETRPAPRGWAIIIPIDD